MRRPFFQVMVMLFAAIATSFGLAAPAQASPYPCAPVGNAGNEICIQHVNNNTGVRIWYWKRVGNPVTVRFSYTSGSFGHYDDGWFVASIRSTEWSYVWNNANPGRCVNGTLHVSTGERYSTGDKCL